MSDFVGLAANICYDNFKKECLVIGMSKMKGSHNAEYIKDAIKSLINDYDFDKLKIKGYIIK